MLGDIATPLSSSLTEQKEGQSRRKDPKKRSYPTSLLWAGNPKGLANNSLRALRPQLGSRASRLYSSSLGSLSFLTLFSHLPASASSALSLSTATENLLDAGLKANRDAQGGCEVTNPVGTKGLCLFCFVLFLHRHRNKT